MIATGLLFLTLAVTFTVAIGFTHEAIRTRRRRRRVPAERYDAISHVRIVDKEPTRT